MWLGEIPSPYQYLLISDENFDKFEGEVDSEDIFKEMTTVVICNNCGRLLIFWDKNNREATSYKRE